MKLISVIIGALFLQSGIAFAAATPNLVGTWDAVSGYWSATGTESNPAPAEQFQKPVHQKLIIAAQQEKTFNGNTFLYNGQSRFIAGVIGADGKSIILSSDNGSSAGSVNQDNNQISICGASILSTRNFAFCTVFKRAK